jgi:DNA-binding NarL/FixJ family response regulator
LIVDDNSSFREETRRLLEQQGIEIVGGAGSGNEALQQIAELRPDVVLIDIDLGGESGLALARHLDVSAPQTAPRMILTSLHEESDYADLIEASPAVGFVAKTELSAAAITQMLGVVDHSDRDEN